MAFLATWHNFVETRFEFGKFLKYAQANAERLDGEDTHNESSDKDLSDMESPGAKDVWLRA